MSEERRFDVLRAIIEDYVSTQEPVGSRMVAQRHQLGVSPATIRNDMAYLEEAGLIAQPHTSAGRVPTDEGYRFFVDRLAALRPLSSAERTAIERFLGSAVDLDDILERSARLLARLTRQVALVAYPTLSLQVIRHVEIVPVGGNRMLVVLITSAGQVEQRTFVLDAPASDEDLEVLRTRIGQRIVGQRLTDLTDMSPLLGTDLEVGARSLAAAMIDFISEAVIARDERIVLAGTAHLARGGIESLHSVLEALEEHVVLLKLLTEMTDDGPLALRIGHENPHASLHETTIVSSTYGSGGNAHVATLGPTRIDYVGTMAAVRAVARYMTRILAN